MRVTNGTFKYTRRIKPGDPNEYNAPFREATAELSFLYAEEDAGNPAVDDFMNAVRDATVDQVHRMLVNKPAVPPAQEKVLEAHRANQADDAYRQQLQDAQDAAIQEKAVEPKTPTPAATMVVDLAAAEKKTPDRRATRTPQIPDPADVDVLAPEPVKISTEDFLAAITRKNAERMARPESAGPAKRDPKVIRDLVGKYVQLPKTARDVPLELRQQFLDELKEL